MSNNIKNVIEIYKFPSDKKETETKTETKTETEKNAQSAECCDLSNLLKEDSIITNKKMHYKNKNKKDKKEASNIIPTRRKSSVSLPDN